MRAQTSMWVCRCAAASAGFGAFPSPKRFCWTGRSDEGMLEMEWVAYTNSSRQVFVFESSLISIQLDVAPTDPNLCFILWT